MTQPKRMRLLGLLAVASIAFAACTGGATPAPTPPPTPTPAPGDTPAPTDPPGTLPAPELTSVKIGLSVTETSQFASKAAEVLGIYAANGITAEVSVFEGDGKTTAALQAGQLDVAMVGVSSAVSSQITDSPMVVLSVNAVLLTDNIVCQGDVKTADDVKGKRIAISTFGGTSNGAALLGIKALNLTTNDVVITQVGGQSARIAALQGGSIECAVVDSNLEQEMIDQGFSILVHLKTAGVEWGRSGMAVRKDWLAKNPNTALVLVASALAAQNLYWTDPAAMAKAYADFNQLELADAEKQVADFVEIGNRSMTWADGAFENPKEVLATVNPDIIDVPVSSAYDRSLLQTLVDIGYYEKIGSPAP
ncbi:MAG: ABC transporter substrate-binding protein [Chloroflexota bacterium]